MFGRFPGRCCAETSSLQWLALGDDERQPLVLLHGFTGAPASWREVVRCLPPGQPAVGLVLPGHCGRGPAMPETFHDVAQECLATLDALGVSQWHLCGYSLGGRVAIGMAVACPTFFSKVTLLGASPGLRHGEERATRAEQDRRWIAMLRDRGIREFAERWEQQPILVEPAHVHPGRLREARAIRRQHDAAGLARCMEVLGLGAMPSYWDALADLMMPVTLVAGSRDAKFTAIARAMADCLSSPRVEIIADCGHNPVLVAPDRVANLLSTTRNGPLNTPGR